jgi:hypothetical protein
MTVPVRKSRGRPFKPRNPGAFAGGAVSFAILNARDCHSAKKRSI